MTNELENENENELEELFKKLNVKEEIKNKILASNTSADLLRILKEVEGVVSGFEIINAGKKQNERIGVVEFFSREISQDTFLEYLNLFKKEKFLLK